MPFICFRFSSSICRSRSQAVVSTVNPPAQLPVISAALLPSVALQTHRRNSRTTGLHTTTPGRGTSFEGGLHEYCIISRSGHSFKSMAGPLRNFSWKLTLTVLRWSGRVSAEKTGTGGAMMLGMRGRQWLSRLPEAPGVVVGDCDMQS